MGLLLWPFLLSKEANEEVGEGEGDHCCPQDPHDGRQKIRILWRTEKNNGENFKSYGWFQELIIHADAVVAEEGARSALAQIGSVFQVVQAAEAGAATLTFVLQRALSVETCRQKKINLIILLNLKVNTTSAGFLVLVAEDWPDAAQNLPSWYFYIWCCWRRVYKTREFIIKFDFWQYFCYFSSLNYI